MRPVQSRWPWLIVVAVVAAAAAWLLRPQPSLAPGVARSTLPAAATPAASADGRDAAPPAVAHPIDPADAADEAIPALADSDAAGWEALMSLVDDASVLDVLLRDHVVQRLVVMIDNLPEPRITTRALAMRPLPGSFATDPGADGASLRIAPANAQRYAPYGAAT